MISRLIPAILAIVLAFGLQSFRIRNHRASLLNDSTPIFHPSPSGAATYVSILKAGENMTLSWIGDADNGSLLGSGIYFYKVFATDKEGNPFPAFKDGISESNSSDAGMVIIFR